MSDLSSMASLSELLRRAQLAKQMGVGNSTPNALAPPDPRDEALQSYRQALNTPQPSQSSYHPSMGRRIAGGLGGALIGLSNPQAGADFAHKTVFGPLDQQISQYQQNLARKKEAFETEQGVSKEKSQEEELLARRKAEESRAGAEEARRKGEEWKTSPEAQAFELKKTQFAHPGSPGQPFDLELSNGQKVNGAMWTRDGWKDPVSGVMISSDLVTKATRVGSPTQAQSRNANEYNDFHTGYLKTHPEANEAEISAAYDRQKAQIGAQFPKPPQTLLETPEGKLIAGRPGTNVPEGSMTPQQRGAITEGTTATRQMKETAPKVINLANQALKDIDAQVNSLGPMKSRWAEFMAGKIGAPNPEFTKLRTNIMLLQTLLMRMHLGARGGNQIMDHFKSLIDASKQDPENLKAAIGEIINYAKDIQGGAAEDSGTLPGGITIDQINAEIERRKKSAK